MVVYKCTCRHHICLYKCFVSSMFEWLLCHATLHWQSEPITHIIIGLQDGFVIFVHSDTRRFCHRFSRPSKQPWTLQPVRRHNCGKRTRNCSLDQVNIQHRLLSPAINHFVRAKTRNMFNCVYNLPVCFYVRTELTAHSIMCHPLQFCP